MIPQIEKDLITEKPDKIYVREEIISPPLEAVVEKITSKTPKRKPKKDHSRAKQSAMESVEKEV